MEQNLDWRPDPSRQNRDQSEAPVPQPPNNLSPEQWDIEHGNPSYTYLESSGPVEIRYINVEKGNGLFTKRDVTLGDIILEEKPLFRVCSVPEIYSKDIYAVWKALSLEKLDVWRQLAMVREPAKFREWAKELGFDPSEEAGVEAASVIAKFTTNRFRGLGYACVGVRASRINHSCVPNATSFYDSLNSYLIIRAAKNIQAGEEVTLSYVQPMQERARRMQLLLDNHKIMCKCPACPMIPPEGGYAAETEWRRSRLHELQVSCKTQSTAFIFPLTSKHEIQNTVPLDPKDEIAKYSEMIDLLKEEPSMVYEQFEVYAWSPINPQDLC